MNQELTKFLNWWLENRATSFIDGQIVNIDGDVTETLIYRNQQFQVEQLSVAPNTVLTPHGHPNVDSYMVYVSGQLQFDVGGDSHTPSIPYDEFIRVPAGCVHGGNTGQNGGVFLSIQHWLNGVKPTFIFTNPVIQIAMIESIQRDWGTISAMLTPAIEMSDGEETIEHVYSQLMAGNMLLATVKVTGKITMVFTLNVVTYGSGLKELALPLMGGAGLEDLKESFMPFVEDVAKVLNCNSVVGYAVRKGWARKLKNFGWEPVREIIKYRVKS